jgi:hypothetical protein
MELELVLKRYEALNPAREFRCFVRDDILLGESIFLLSFFLVPLYLGDSSTRRIPHKSGGELTTRCICPRLQLLPTLPRPIHYRESPELHSHILRRRDPR